MFLNFFYILKESGIPVSPTSFLTLQKALNLGVINSLQDFYNAARSILIKSERYFDLYDQAFAHYFEGIPLIEDSGFEIDELTRGLVAEWLQNPKEVGRLMGLNEKELKNLTPDELLEYFKKRLLDQDGRHDGGSKWIGTGGTSPVGHSGFHPGGLRIGGHSRNKSALKIAGERRYRDYSANSTLNVSTMGEALNKLKNMVPAGISSKVDVDATIYRTMKNAGEIELEFNREMKDKLKVVLMIDNGGWSMDPHIPVVQSLFYHARNNFRQVRTYYFHNTIYHSVWTDPRRMTGKVPITDFIKFDRETRLIILGDASMAPNELFGYNGPINIADSSPVPSVQCLQSLLDCFPHAVWLNPVSREYWKYTETILSISELFPMFPLTLDGLDKAVQTLMV